MDTVRDMETHPGLTPEYSRERAKQLHPIKRQPRVDELAWACAFLCSERAAAITGSAIHVDAGAKMFG
jgi:enoyl-[acyl-carrier-protein] reductase (NADH)